METKRLMDVVDTLENWVPKQKNIVFNMNHWLLDDDEHPCKTAACAAGSYKLRYPKRKFPFTNSICGKQPRCGMSTVANHFGIERREASYIFDPFFYDFCTPISKTSVKNRILKFIRAKKDKKNIDAMILKDSGDY